MRNLRPDLRGFKNLVSIYQICLIIFLGTILFFGVSVPATYTTPFDKGEKHSPAPFGLDDIWFYTPSMSKKVPDIDLNWLLIVFRSDTTKAKDIVDSNEHIADFFCDSNLGKDACFFKLQEGMNEIMLQGLIAKLNPYEFVSYAHPALHISDKTYTFFNAFELEWKTGVDPDIQNRLMIQAHVSPDKNKNTYTVNIFETPFFKAINLLAEDIHVLKANPFLVEIKASVSAELRLAINGANIGDKVPFSLNVVFSDLIRIESSSVANIRLKPSDIQKTLFDVQFDSCDYVETASKSPIQISGHITFYAPGEFMIPPVRIKYMCSDCPEKEVKTVETKAVPFKVASIVPSKAENKLMVPTDVLDPDYKIGYYHKKANTNLVLSGLCFFIASASLLWFLGKIYAIKKARKKLQVKKKADILAEKLSLFLNKTPLSPHWIYMAKISKLLRKYLIEKYEIAHYAGGGTGVIFFESVRGDLPEAHKAGLHRLLKTIDESAAIELKSCSEIDDFRSELLRYLEDSKLQ